nr:unnamed protein product [Digitaria exilis]
MSPPWPPDLTGSDSHGEPRQEPRPSPASPPAAGHLAPPTTDPEPPHPDLLPYSPLAPSQPQTTEIKLAKESSGIHISPPAATPAPATTSARRLSPSAAPFFPSVGRGKAQRWVDGSPSSTASSSPVASYRDALLRPSPPRSSLAAVRRDAAAEPSSFTASLTVETGQGLATVDAATPPVVQPLCDAEGFTTVVGRRSRRRRRQRLAQGAWTRPAAEARPPTISSGSASSPPDAFAVAVSGMSHGTANAQGTHRLRRRTGLGDPFEYAAVPCQRTANFLPAEVQAAFLLPGCALSAAAKGCWMGSIGGGLARVTSLGKPPQQWRPRCRRHPTRRPTSQRHVTPCQTATPRGPCQRSSGTPPALPPLTPVKAHRLQRPSC